MSGAASGGRIQSYRILKLLNPAHPEFGKISIGKPRAFKADPRLGPLAPDLIYRVSL
jgi:hypothetical protein